MSVSCKGCKKCLFGKKNGLPPCISLLSPKWGYLKNFLLNDVSKYEYISIIPKLKCLSIIDDHIEIDKTKCIKCLFCISNCPKGLIKIENDLSLTAKCSEFDGSHETNNNFIDSLFNKQIISIPYIEDQLLQNKYKNLDEFTMVDETQNIAVRGAGLIKQLSNEETSRLGLEIKMIIEDRDRGGRLDICLLSNNLLLCAETKVSFKKMMQENRYSAQMISYKSEINKTLSDLNMNHIKPYELLLIGGRESDLLYIKHASCTSKVGMQSDIFYNNLLKHNLFFISATALRGLTLKKILVDKDKYSLENVISKIIIPNNYGLTSAGVITKKDKDFEIIPLSDFL